MCAGEATAAANSVSSKRGKCMIERDKKGLVEYRGMDVTQNCRCLSEPSSEVALATGPALAGLLVYFDLHSLRFLSDNDNDTEK